MKKDVKRNSLAVRLGDREYEAFLMTTGTQYSQTLRELIAVYTEYFKAMDANLPLAERVQTVMSRVPVVKKLTPSQEKNVLLREKRNANRS